MGECEKPWPFLEVAEKGNTFSFLVGELGQELLEQY
jgi:hypothetical protein